jgi:peptidoglycan/LPS O-acetylase OafA/YrhL
MPDTVNRNSNNFDFLRLVGALLVIFFTAYALLGTYKVDPLFRLTNGALHTGNLGVIIFFIISGYLITMSWDKRRDIVRFIWARFLRLVPALVGVALVTVFIIGPLTTHQNLLDYFTNRATWGYFSIITVFFPSYGLPSVFINNPVSLVNGSLWSLPVESTMYIVILALGAMGILYKKSFITAVILALVGVFLYINIPMLHSVVPLVSHNTMNILKDLTILVFPLYFLIGSLYYLHQDKIKYDLRLVLVAFIVWVLTFWSTELFILSSFICIPYIVLGLAFTRIPYINTIGKKADISYGLYIFHYPVQQTLINFFSLDSLTLLTLSLLITVPLAWLSWHLIESKALGIKNIDLKQLSLRQAVWSR